MCSEECSWLLDLALIRERYKYFTDQNILKKLEKMHYEFQDEKKDEEEVEEDIQKEKQNTLSKLQKMKTRKFNSS